MNNAVWDLAPGGLTVPIDANGTWVVARMVEKVAPAPKAFDSVKEQVETAYRLQEGSKLARAAADKLVATAKSDGSLFKAAGALRGEVEKTDAFTRGGPFVPGLGAGTLFKERAFALTDANRLADQPVEVAGDWIAMELGEVQKPGDEEITKQVPAMRKSMLEQRRAGVFTRYLNELKQKAQIAVDRQKVESLPTI